MLKLNSYFDYLYLKENEVINENDYNNNCDSNW